MQSNGHQLDAERCLSHLSYINSLEFHGRNLKAIGLAFAIIGCDLAADEVV